MFAINYAIFVGRFKIVGTYEIYPKGYTGKEDSKTDWETYVADSNSAVKTYGIDRVKALLAELKAKSTDNIADVTLTIGNPASNGSGQCKVNWVDKTSSAVHFTFGKVAKGIYRDIDGNRPDGYSEEVTYAELTNDPMHLLPLLLI